MNIIENAMNVLIGLIFIGIVIYAGFHIFIAFAKAAFGLNFITGIGFIVSIIVAACKGVLTLESMLVILGGTILSYAAGTLIPFFLNNVFAGQFVAAGIYLFVIIYLWSKGQEMKGM